VAGVAVEEGEANLAAGRARHSRAPSRSTAV
jgi:hypothetical protein